MVGYYDALLTFADHKAERFFTTHGFADDPILTAKYRYSASYNVDQCMHVSLFGNLVKWLITGKTVILWCIYLPSQVSHQLRFVLFITNIITN